MTHRRSNERVQALFKWLAYGAVLGVLLYILFITAWNLHW